jgi:tetratricopeptide (TPR) repeat protein
MQYDRLGFPVPPEFDVPAGIDDFDSSAPQPGRRRGTTGPGSGKRLVVLGLLLGIVVPGLALPVAMPEIRRAVVEWSAERAFDCEAGGDVAGAIDELGRAIAWADPQAASVGRLLCWRAMLRIENGDARGAVDDTSQAILTAPGSTQPRRVRALAHVVLDDADAALADANAAVEMGGRDSPEALNHRAYIRALVGRELPQALDDIDRALAGDDEGAPELLDTRGYILHLLGRHQEAIDLLNRAIARLQQQRRQVALLSGRADPAEIAYQLRSLDHSLAVMHHHRGLACRAAGLEGQAAQDLEVAERKGFAPERGIF